MRVTGWPERRSRGKCVGNEQKGKWNQEDVGVRRALRDGETHTSPRIFPRFQSNSFYMLIRRGRVAQMKEWRQIQPRVLHLIPSLEFSLILLFWYPPVQEYTTEDELTEVNSRDSVAPAIVSLIDIHRIIALDASHALNASNG